MARESPKLEFSFTMTPRTAEVINWIISQGINQLEFSATLRKRHGIKERDIEDVEAVQESLVTQLTKPV